MDVPSTTQQSRFAELESLLGDMERARAIYELAISQPRLDMPELVWKAYIDFEVGQGERDKVRELHERLLERTVHVKVWMNYAQFEMSSGDEDSVSLARRVFERANQALKASSEKEERVMLLEAWKEFEAQHGDDESRAKLNSKLPRRAKKRVKTYNDEGVEEGWEEVFDYIFPEDEAAKPNLKLLEKAKAWKKAMEEKQGNKIGEEGANKENEEEERDKERDREEEDEKKDERDRDSDDERDDREEDSDSEGEKEREVETEH
ncbi:protein crooked neck-like [Diaphorina citri]|uniref:Protein crooked neck-like n=1 Tax=Diaphorina citri TaxID=121845 RepID=A0A1S4EK90_DIACI|nr:protein crooked neck-like [Diaphorina citri]